MRFLFKTTALAVLLSLGAVCSAQVYPGGLVDKGAALVGNEFITVSDIEAEIQTLRAQGILSDRTNRCEVLEQIMTTKLFLMQARIDSLAVNPGTVEAELNNRVDQMKTGVGGEEALEEYFGQPLYKLRQTWRKQMEDSYLTQMEQQQIADNIPEVTPFDVRNYLDTVDKEDIPMVPIKYRMSQICVYPDREAAAIEVKERLLAIRERIMNGERFATLARLYSEDTESARRGGELGMASKNIFWPVFSDAAMSLKPGMISQIVETPDGYHIIEVLEKKGDMFNARHILLKPKYTEEDQEKAFARLDSLKTAIDSSKISFELAAMFYSEDPATRTNGGQMSDPVTGSASFEIDQLKPQDYAAVRDLEPGQISEPIASLDNEGYQNNRPGNLVYKIIRLDKIIDSHPASFEHDYTELLQQLQGDRRMQAINDFVDTKIKETHIIIDPLFKDCNFSREGWKEKIRQD